MSIFNDLFALTVLSFLAIIAIVVSLRAKDVVHPLLVFFTPLYVQYLLYFFVYSNEYRLDFRTNEILVLSVSAFFVGVFVRYLVFHIDYFKKPSNYVIDNAIYKMTKARPFLIYAGAIGFLIGLYFAYENGTRGPSSFFYNLRYAATVEGAGLGAAPYLLLFLQLWLLFSICLKRHLTSLKGYQIAIVLLVLIISSFFTMARTALFFTMISFAGAYYLSRRYLYKTNPKVIVSIIGFIGFLVGGFIVIAVLTKKRDMANVFDSFLGYLAYPIISFDRYILNNPAIHSGHNVFYPVAKIGEMFGVLAPWHKVVPGVTSVDFNAFTYLNAPYLDFGKSGAITLSFILGVIVSLIYSNARKGKPFYIVFYSLMLFPLFMSFYEYQFGLVSWIYYFVIMVGVNLLFRNMPKPVGKVSQGKRFI